MSGHRGRRSLIIVLISRSFLLRSSPCFLESKQTVNAVWMQFRPPTNVDHPDVLRAREFLQDRRQALLAEYGHTSSSVATVSLSSDPLARVILDDAALALRDVSLEFWSENSHQSLFHQDGSKEKAIQPSPVIVPCAVYAGSSAIAIESCYSIDQAHKAVLGHFEEMLSCDAKISQGDLISISETGYDYPHLSQVSRQWYLVHKIDLLFARLLVSRSTHAPPIPWLMSSEEQPSQPKHWIEISKLWHVLVCSPVNDLGKSQSQRFQ